MKWSPSSVEEVAQIHLAQGLDCTSMVVSWATLNAGATQVKYGLTSNEEDMTLVDGEQSTTYTIFDYTSPQLHHITLTNLLPKTRYYYIVGDFSASEATKKGGEDSLNTPERVGFSADSMNDNNQEKEVLHSSGSEEFKLMATNNSPVSGIHSFVTQPATGDFSEPVVFGVIGDLGQTTDSVKTLNHLIANQKLAMILHVGDLSYANCNHPEWDTYGIMIEDLSSQRAWMCGSGNHEIEYNKNDDRLYLAFEERYKMPQVKPAEYGAITKYFYDSCTPSEFQSEYNFGNSFFSFTSGPAFIINVNPYSVTNSTSPQYLWLEAELAGVDRSVTPWVIVMMHCPWYSSNKAHYEEWQTVEMKNNMEAMFHQYDVNIVFSGHVHAIERSYPTYMDLVDSERGTTYINIGDAGNAEGHSTSYYAPPVWSAYTNGTQYGHGELTLVNTTHMEWAWVRNLDGDEVHSDSVTICNSALGVRADCMGNIE